MGNVLSVTNASKRLDLRALKNEQEVCVYTVFRKKTPFCFLATLLVMSTDLHKNFSV